MSIVVGALILVLGGVGYTAVKLRVMTIWGGAQKEYLDQMFAEYSSLNPDVRISHETVPGTGAASYTEVLQTGMASGTGPDVFFNWGGELAGFFIDAGYCEPLDKYYEQYGWNSFLIPWTVEAIRRNGKLWGVPISSHAMTFWYRKDLWEKLGLSEPKSYEEVEAICEKAKASGIYAFTTGGKYGWMPMRLLDYLLEVVAGPELHDKLNTSEESWNRPEVVEMYRLFQKWANNWIVPGFVQMAPDTDARMPLYQGQALMILEGSWFESVLKNDGQDINLYGFFAHPTNHEPLRLSGFPEQFMLNAKSVHKKEALDFINWFLQRDTQQKWFGKAINSTCVIGVYPDENEAPNTYKFRKLIEQLVDTYPPTDQAFPPELMHKYFEIQDAVALNMMTPEEAAANIQGAIEDYKQEKGITVFGSAAGVK
ncbi:MAG: ABC transporter substrate-binding protein [Candidatus Caldatribacteriaceae bacterium]